MSRILTGIKPTSHIHLGNYVGAIKPGLRACGDFDESLFFIADYHALNGLNDGKKLRNNSYQVAASWLACGLDPKKTIVYCQSDVPEITELAWILSCVTPKGFMNRAHAYKAKRQVNIELKKKEVDSGINMGLFNYPVLMAADILLFSADKVPVGEDQLQHLEFTRDIAGKFNNCYGDIFCLPEAILSSKQVLPGLDGEKMSSSRNNFISLFSDEKKLRKLIMKIKSDSSAPGAPKDPDNSLLMDFYKFFATTQEIEKMRDTYLKGVSWGEVKESLFEVVNREVSPHRELYVEMINDTAQIDEVLKNGAEKARALAHPLMKDIRKAIGVLGFS